VRYLQNRPGPWTALQDGHPSRGPVRVGSWMRFSEKPLQRHFLDRVSCLIALRRLPSVSAYVRSSR
jgi:hypothetical protein